MPKCKVVSEELEEDRKIVTEFFDKGSESGYFKF